jgi:hypothetical protein
MNTNEYEMFSVSKVQRHNWPRMRLHHLAWIAGLLGLPLSHYWLAAQVEPFYSAIYCFLWWSYIFAIDFVVCKLRGTSLLRDRPKEFLFLTLWSVPVWLLFELVNLRMQNWYYVMAPWSLSQGMFYLVLAFGTVLPGIFETMELVVGLIEKLAPGGRIGGPAFTIGLWGVRIQLSIGALMLVLLLAFPRYCFSLAWGFAFFLTDPICYWKRRKDQNQVGRSLQGQLASGDYTRLVALLLAGFITGGLWEGWNFTARTKWIYSVPFFDELKLGEMPVLGFLGFPPFSLECYALVNLLSLFRGGRNWELPSSENQARPGLPAWGMITSSIVLPLVILICAVAPAQQNIGSFSEPVDSFFEQELGEKGAEALRRLNALEGNQFLKLKERPPEIDPALYERMRRIVLLSECKGMGLRNALALDAMHISGLPELSRQNPPDLARELQKQGLQVRLEEVKIWIRAAKRAQ